MSRAGQTKLNSYLVLLFFSQQHVRVRKYPIWNINDKTQETLNKIQIIVKHPSQHPTIHIFSQAGSRTEQHKQCGPPSAFGRCIKLLCSTRKQAIYNNVTIKVGKKKIQNLIEKFPIMKVIFPLVILLQITMQCYNGYSKYYPSIQAICWEEENHADIIVATIRNGILLPKLF